MGSKSDSQLQNGTMRQEHFSKSIAVGSEAFVKKMKDKLAGRVAGRRVLEADNKAFQLKEPVSEYHRKGLDPSDKTTSWLPYTNRIPWHQSQSLE